ncbi:MAG: nitroreductase family protein [Acidimicrobiales bacterium]
MDLLEGIATTRAIRRTTTQPVTDEQLATVLFAASRAPSGSNRQPFRFVVLRDSPQAHHAKAIIGEGARALWAGKRRRDGYDTGSGSKADSPKARTAATLDRYVDRFEEIPVVILPCAVRYRPPHPYEGASVYPAVQNLLLAARAIGLGGTLTTWQAPVEDELRAVLAIPDDVFIAGTVTLGHPEGGHGPVRRRPLSELVYEDQWEQSPTWAVDPPGTRYTSAGPPDPGTG